MIPLGHFFDDEAQLKPSVGSRDRKTVVNDLHDLHDPLLDFLIACVVIQLRDDFQNAPGIVDVAQSSSICEHDVPERVDYHWLSGWLRDNRSISCLSGTGLIQQV